MAQTQLPRDSSTNAGPTGTSDAGPAGQLADGFQFRVWDSTGLSVPARDIPDHLDNELEQILEGTAGWTATLQVKVNAAVRDATAGMYIQDGKDMFQIVLYDGSDFSYQNPGSFLS